MTDKKSLVMDSSLMSKYLAAAILINTCNESQPRTQPWIKANMESLSNQCKEHLVTLDEELASISSSLKSQSDLKIYQFLCQNSQIKDEILKVFLHHTVLLNAINLDKNLVQQIIQTKHVNCLYCSEKLERKFRYIKDCKGSIALKYDNKLGVIVAVSYVYECPKSGCGAVYYHNRNEYKGDITFESVLDACQMNSGSTFLDDNVVNEAQAFRLDDGLSLRSYTEKWNDRWRDQIDQIDLHLRLNTQTLGHRKNTDSSLCPNRLEEAIYLRRILIKIQRDLKMDAVITQQQKEKYIASKEEKLIGKTEISHYKTKSLSCTDYFNILMDNYWVHLRKTDLGFLNEIPVKDGKYLALHLLMGGDCDVNINRPVCLFPRDIHQQQICNLTKDKQVNPALSFVRCTRSPQRGNGHSHCYTSCQEHVLMMKQHGLPPKASNDFCRYNKLQRQINSTKSDKKKEEFIKEISKFKANDVNLFREVKQKLMGEDKRPIRACVNRGRANVNEQTIMLNDTQAMMDIDDILEEEFVDPALFSNPEG